jgi:flagella basal body P-ring formation protein FlgA
MIMKRLSPVSLALGILLGLPTTTVLSADAQWGADDLRRVVREWLSASGKAIPPDDNIGPIDNRLRLPACNTAPTLAPRSARSTSIVIKCTSPVAWEQIVRIDGYRPPDMATTASATNSPAKDTWKLIVVRSSLPAGTVISADMIEERTTGNQPGDLQIKSREEAIGMRLSAAIGAGSILTKRNVARAPDILKGEKIILMAIGSGFAISADGIAEEDGYEGDILHTRNIKSGTSVAGKLGASGIVEIRVQ